MSAPDRPSRSPPTGPGRRAGRGVVPCFVVPNANHVSHPPAVPEAGTLTEVQRRAVGELLRVAPVADDLGRRFQQAGYALALVGGSVRDAVEGFARTFIQEVASTRRGDIVRLIVAEGPRFPSIADFYYREVVSRGLAGMRALIELGVARGEIAHKELARFPQILVAPALIAVIWQSLFSKHAPLDVTEMLRVHLDLIFGERRAT